jgi:uncharacterized protein YoaH (UPF0181 family)
MMSDLNESPMGTEDPSSAAETIQELIAEYIAGGANVAILLNNLHRLDADDIIFYSFQDRGEFI